MIPPWPPAPPPRERSLLASAAADWAAAHGLSMRLASSTTSGSGNDSELPAFTHAPFALFPSPLPRSSFDLAISLQPAFNALVDAVARDHDFLATAIASLAAVDRFSSRLFQVYSDSFAHAQSQPIWMAIHRSDYMLHSPSSNSKQIAIHQVELNTISTAFVGLSAITSSLHHYLADRTDFYNASSSSTPDILRSSLPENSCLSDVAAALSKAWSLYAVKDAVILMVVQPAERNVFDQRWIEYKVFESCGAHIVRMSLAEIAAHHTSKSLHNNNALILDGMHVAVVYFRSGYSPADYPSVLEWSARLAIEKSTAIKCPPIAYQLVGTKKMQQILAAPGILERFVPDPEQARLLRSCFTGLYPLDESPDGLAAYQRALERPGDYVMKPQREGGGNNIYGDQVRAKLLELTPSERKAYILMDLIRPPTFRNTLVRLGEPVDAEVVSELGIYGVFIGDGTTVHLNASAGHLLRTKASDSNEGGVAAGFAVLDSPFLLD